MRRPGEIKKVKKLNEKFEKRESPRKNFNALKHIEWMNSANKSAIHKLPKKYPVKDTPFVEKVKYPSPRYNFAIKYGGKCEDNVLTDWTILNAF